MKPSFKNPVGGYSIVFSLDQGYLRPALTLMDSIVAHALPSDQYSFFILHENISDFCQKVVHTYADNLGVCVYFINISHYDIKAPASSFHFTKAMYFRLLIPSLFKEWERILYVDADVVALSHIGPVFETVEKDKAFAASKDDWISGIFSGHAENVLKSGKGERYFGSGLLVLNCQNISEEQVSECLENIGKYSTCPDQDILNRVYEGQVNFVPREAHFVVLSGSGTKESMGEEVTAEREAIGKGDKKPILVHYAGNIKPWLSGLKENHEGYWYFDDYQNAKEKMEARLEKILLRTAHAEFSGG